MKTNRIPQLPLIAFIAALLSVPMLGFAACDNACNTDNQFSCSLTTSTMAKSTSGTLSVSITNKQQQSASSLSTTLQDLGWFTGTTTTSTISSLNAGASTSVDYTITPSSDGAQSACVRLGSTCTADCGSITITSPASLSVTSLTTASSSISTSSSTTASATIYNSGTETAGSSSSITATLSSSSGCTISSATKTIGTLAGKESNSQSWTVTAGSSAATCTLTLSASGTAGGSDSKTASLTVTAASSNASTSTGGGSSGGGTNATTNATKETKLFSTTAGASKLLTFTQSAVTEIELKTAASKTGVQLSVAESLKPSGAVDPISSAAGSTYKYIEITKSNVVDSDFSLIKIKFKVPKSWITSNSIDASKVYLARYVSGWNALPTVQTSSDSSNYYYEATSSGFSTFAVVGEKSAAPTPTPTPTPKQPTTPTQPGQPEQPSAPSVPSLPGSGVAPPTLDIDANTLVGIVILFLAIGFGILHHYFLKGKKSQKYEYKQK